MLLRTKRYWTEALTATLWTYELKAITEQLHALKVNDHGITPMEHFSGTTSYITLKIYRTWGYTVYAWDAILQGNIDRLLKW